MKFWTVQTRDVVDRICEQGFFQPDFSKSRYLQKNVNLVNLYAILLDSFNSIHHMHLSGLVFAFAKSDGRGIYEIEDIEDFVTFIRDRKAVLGEFWKTLDKDNFVIMELSYDEDFNPIFIDMNDFQFLMPPIMIMPPYTSASVERICADIQRGQISMSEFPSGVIQAHLPYITYENIVNMYTVFDING